MDKQSMHKSWLLSNYMVRFIGTKRQIFVRRRQLIWEDLIWGNDTYSRISTGSRVEGFDMKDSDFDIMSVFKNVLVLDPLTNKNIPIDTTIFYIRRSDCRPGYVLLELWRKEQNLASRSMDDAILKILVPTGNNPKLLSSDIFREVWDTDTVKEYSISRTTSGPCRSIRHKEYGQKFDLARSLYCPSWPVEASEWATRTRIYGWPPKHLIDKIVHEGCHLVLVGDKTSNDTFLQWRISFATAERKLVYSLTYLQFKVHGLLKYLLKQIESMINAKTGEEDILCSYFLKTLIFYAVENPPSSLWQEKYTFVCFMYCLNLLIDWVNSAYCPNYFIPTDNMFLRKVQGRNRRELLNILVELREKKWECLSVETFFNPSIGECLQYMDEVYGYSPTREELECLSDLETYNNLFYSKYKQGTGIQSLKNLGILLNQSQSDEDDAVCYGMMVTVLSAVARTEYCEYFGSTNNKQTYSTFRKCKRLLTPIANMCVSPGQMLLATFFYITGNYDQTLDLCAKMTYSLGILTNTRAPKDDFITYEKRYCGKGNSFYHKCKESCVNELHLEKENFMFYPAQLHQELFSLPLILVVPPLPYAIFLSFLCYYDHGESRKCHEALEHLQSVCVYDERQGGDQYWAVYNLLSICYQLIGDKEMPYGLVENHYGLCLERAIFHGKDLKHYKGNKKSR